MRRVRNILSHLFRNAEKNVQDKSELYKVKEVQKKFKWVDAQLQSTLGFETLDIAAALDLETATPLTELRQYINSNLGFRNLKIWLLYSKIAAVVVAKPSENKNKHV